MHYKRIIFNYVLREKEDISLVTRTHGVIAERSNTDIIRHSSLDNKLMEVNV